MRHSPENKISEALQVILIHRSSCPSGPTDTGMRRLTLDDDDAKARTWFVEETKRLGCTRHVVDEVS